MNEPGSASVVLVHGSFVDGSGWRAVYDTLTGRSIDVSVVQNPTASLAADVAATRLVLDQQPGPVVLVGHSYGGVIITEAGNHDNVAALVYIAAFAPDKGESVNTLIANPPPGSTAPPILPPVDGVLLLDRSKFAEAFAADVDPGVTRFMADSQLPWGIEALTDAVTEPAWRSKQSSYLVATEDHMIPPAAQRAMAERAGSIVTETVASHAVYVSRPDVVADIIERAVRQLVAA